jgi:hypothetical protein
MKYKLRAECSKDVVGFLNNVHSQLSSFSLIKDKELPDVEFEFETDLALDEIILILKDLDDAHVMYQTVKLIDEYTGERNYELTLFF